MLSKIFRFLLGILLIPVDIGYALAFSEHLVAIRPVRSSELYFLLGITAYLAFHAMVAAPMRAYVFSHELMHAAAAWISGGQVKGFKVGSKKGSVTTNKATAFVALAPYLVPVYAILWALGFGAASLFWKTSSWAWLFFFGLGVWLTFHLVFTVAVLKQKQSDLEVAGPLLALDLILLGNITLVLGAMGLVVPEIRFSSYWVDGFRYSGAIYRTIVTQLFQ